MLFIMNGKLLIRHVNGIALRCLRSFFCFTVPRIFHFHQGIIDLVLNVGKVG